MNTQLCSAPFALVLALLTTSLATACKIEDGPPPLKDSAIGAPPPAPPSPIADTSLRPRAEVSEPATLIRGTPAAVTQLMRADTASSLTQVDSAPASRATESDLDILRHELVIPVTGVVASQLFDTFGELRGGTRQHEALDILAARGTPVLSATSGRVLKLFDSKAGGLMVYAADSTERFILMYGHLDAYSPGLAEGQALRRGQQIGTVGTTGNAPPGTPHLHFAIARSVNVSEWWKGSPVNPFLLLKP
jgi:murein DD-endopeptidase MepM/ murein hydrolase activator NlpD